jgi:hypothetical protein
MSLENIPPVTPYRSEKFDILGFIIQMEKFR